MTSVCVCQRLPEKSHQKQDEHCRDKVSLQIVTTNQCKINRISHVFIYFLYGILCNEHVYFVLMKVVTLSLLSHFCSLQGRKCNNKVNTSFVVVTFSMPAGEINVTTSQNVEVAAAYASIPAVITCNNRNRKTDCYYFLTH